MNARRLMQPRGRHALKRDARLNVSARFSARRAPRPSGVIVSHLSPAALAERRAAAGLA